MSPDKFAVQVGLARARCARWHPYDESKSIQMQTLRLLFLMPKFSTYHVNVHFSNEQYHTLQVATEHVFSMEMTCVANSVYQGQIATCARMGHQSCTFGSIGHCLIWEDEVAPMEHRSKGLCQKRSGRKDATGRSEIGLVAKRRWPSLSWNSNEISRGGNSRFYTKTFHWIS